MVETDNGVYFVIILDGKNSKSLKVIINKLHNFKITLNLFKLK